MGFFRSLVAILLPGQTRSPSSQELLTEHEEALGRFYPDGAPSGDGTAQYDRLLALHREELEWQLTFKRRVLLTGLAGAILWLGFGVALFLERFAV